MKRLSFFAVLPVAAFVGITPVAPATADPSVSCTADVCIVSISEWAPAPVNSGLGASAIGSGSGLAAVGSSAWLADVVAAFQGGSAYVTPSGATATAYQIASGPDDMWLIIGQQVAARPDGSKVYAAAYKPGNWANHDFADVLVTTAPGSASATGSASHWDVLNQGTTTYGVTLSPDRTSVTLKAYAYSFALPEDVRADIDADSTPEDEGTTVEITPQLLP